MGLLNRFFMTLRRPLSCEDANQFIVLYLDGELEKRTRSKFEQHLAKCSNCATYFDQYQATIRLVKDDPIPPPPQELVAITLEFLNQHLDDPE